MSWLHLTEKVDDSEHASVFDVVACFRKERALLFRFAFLITGDKTAAEQSLINACEMTIKGHSPFRDWLTEWAKVATVTHAVLHCISAIRGCEALYEGQQCTHAEHLSQGDEANLEQALRVILQTDPEILIDQVDALSRAVLVLRVAIRSSIHECVLRLNVSRTAVIAANCRAMMWIEQVQLKPSQQLIKDCII